MVERVQRSGSTGTITYLHIKKFLKDSDSLETLLCRPKDAGVYVRWVEAVYKKRTNYDDSEVTIQNSCYEVTH